MSIWPDPERLSLKSSSTVSKRAFLISRTRRMPGVFSGMIAKGRMCSASLSSSE